MKYEIKSYNYRKKGLRYLDSVEHTLNYLLDIKGRYGKKHLKWHFKNMRFNIRNAITLINKPVEISNLDKITKILNEKDIDSEFYKNTISDVVIDKKGNVKKFINEREMEDA